MASLGRPLLTLVGIVTTVGGFIADWNDTHVFNPNWPPHAKFHNGQTLSMGLTLGLSTLYYLYRPAGVNKESLNTATWLASMYWITQLMAWFFPGSLPKDPEYGEGFPQFYISTALLSLTALGSLLEGNRIAALSGLPKRA